MVGAQTMMIPIKIVVGKVLNSFQLQVQRTAIIITDAWTKKEQEEGRKIVEKYNVQYCTLHHVQQTIALLQAEPGSRSDGKE